MDGTLIVRHNVKRQGTRRQLFKWVFLLQGLYTVAPFRPGLVHCLRVECQAAMLNKYLC